MNIVSFNQIIELNHLLQKKDLQFKVHIRDACGAQSFYIEQLEDSNRVETDEDLFNTIDDYFKNEKMIVVYLDDKYRFKIQQYASQN